MQTWMHVLIYIIAYINVKLISYKLDVYCHYATLACSYILLLEWCKLLLAVLPNMERIWGSI